MAKNINGATLNAAVEAAREFAVKAGKGALHSISANEFEYYMCSFELLDGSGNTKGFMSFAVMPNNIMENEVQITSITKTNRGIATVFNGSFLPKDISLQGTFGRKFRLLSGVKIVEESNDTYFNFGNLGFNPSGRQTVVRTGYGLTQMLRSIIKKSFQVDSNGFPHVLIFKNYALNTHYVVEVMQHSYSQSIENNMLWYYNLEMKAVAPAEAVKRQSERKNFLSVINANSISRGLGKILKSVAKSL